MHEEKEKYKTTKEGKREGHLKGGLVMIRILISILPFPCWELSFYIIFYAACGNLDKAGSLLCEKMRNLK